MIYVETERLALRDWTVDDLTEFRKMNRDPEVMEFFPGLLSDEATDAFYGRIQAEFSALGYGLYAVETKDAREFIGFIGFHVATFEAEFTPCVEIGWRLKRSAWGKGYATEGAASCLRHGAEALGLDRIYSFTARCNRRSERVMQKIGMRKVGEFAHPSLAPGSPLLDHVLYAIDAGDVR